jgi:hypothetical protein
METIKQWLIDHPLIRVKGLEAKVKIPIGTIKVNLNRKIPEKYIAQIEEELSKYGYVGSAATSTPVITHPVAIPTEQATWKTSVEHIEVLDKLAPMNDNKISIDGLIWNHLNKTIVVKGMKPQPVLPYDAEFIRIK